jgi:uncharacterized membrane protein
MNAVLWDWINLLLRWTHVMLGIAWIGTSFHFIWLDASLRREEGQPAGVSGGSWMVHGGGFYHARKFMVAPPVLPKELHWFKYEAYFTWVSGFLLLAVVYYVGAAEFLIDPSVLALSPAAAIAISLGGLASGWLCYDAMCRSTFRDNTLALALGVFALALGAAYGFSQVFSGRAAFLHVGAFLGTIMSANVFFIIIPNQKKVVADLIAGRVPDPALGKAAKQRSLHNNYLTLPVVLMMLSNHYPMLYARADNWLYVAGVLVLGGLVRHYINTKDSGGTGWWLDWLLPAAALLAVGMIASTMDFGRRHIDEGPPATLAQVLPIFEHRCETCHSAHPRDPGFKAPPKGIAFDTPDELRRYAPLIDRMAVQTTAMPLGNKTGMTAEERELIGRWIDGGMKD